MKPTRIATLLAVALAAGVALWLTMRVAYAVLPPLPWTVVAVVVVLAVALLVLARNVRMRIERRPGAPPVEPLVVARYVVLAKASAYVGALVAGAFGGVLVYVLDALQSPTERTDAIVSGAGLVAAIGLCAAALLLEHACRIPRPPQEHKPRVHHR